MGIHDRDYARTTSDAGGSVADSSPSVVKWLIAANVIVLFLQIFVTRPMTPGEIQARWQEISPAEQNYYRGSYYFEEGDESGDSPAASLPQSADKGSVAPPWFVMAMIREPVAVAHEWLKHKTSLVLHGQVWRLLTSAFCHSPTDILHILFNMMALYYFGTALEERYGGKEFLLFYLAAAVFSGLAHVALDLILKRDISAVGASGAVMGVLMVYALLYPRAIIHVMSFPIAARWLVIIFIVIDATPVLLNLAGDPIQTGIGHAAHLGGLAFGYLYWKSGIRLERYWNWLPQLRKGAQRFGQSYPRIARPSPREELAGQVDEILKKVHDSGRDSLTDDERRILDRASERYKRKRD